MTAGAVDATSVAAVTAERMAERLRLYRECVARVARHEGVPREAVEELRKAMAALGLPSFAFRRDVRAWAEAGTARGYRRAELALNHPHLFDEPDAWVRDRIRAVSVAPRALNPGKWR